MPIDFSILERAPTIAQGFMAGQQAAQQQAEQNRLRDMQMLQMEAQRENILAQRSQREQDLRERQAAERIRNALAAAGNDPEKLIQLGPEGVKLATEITALNKARGEVFTQRMSAARQFLDTLDPNDPTAPQRFLQWHEANHRDPIIGPMLAARGITADQARARIDQAVQQGPQAFGQLLLQSKLGTEKFLEMNKPPEPTAGMREYQEAVRQGFKGTFMEYKQSLQPKPPQVNVRLPEQEKAFETGLGKAQAERIMEDQKVAQDARGIIDTVQQGRQLLQSGAITGFGAEALTQIGAALNQIGINFAEDAVANTQAFASNMAQNVGRIIKQFGAGTGLSNDDRNYAEKMAGGKITLDRKAIERILDINERAARNVIVSHNKRVQGIKTNVPLTVEMPSGPPAPAPIPGAPAAAAPAAAPAAAKQVRRTGTLNGRRVIEYTDGSVEYAN